MTGLLMPGAYDHVPVRPSLLLSNVKENSSPVMLGNKSVLTSVVHVAFPLSSNLIITGDCLESYFSGILQFLNPYPNTPEQSLPAIFSPINGSAFTVEENAPPPANQPVLTHIVFSLIFPD
ncbi:hypothetical protein [Nitrosomonas eutropha]|nr:hypothetical protein [Nitrosomonas eutropha]